MSDSNERVCKVRIVGTAPLLMHRFGENAEAELQAKSKKRSGAHTPEQAAKELLYTLPNGKLCQPAEHIYRAMVKSAVNFQITGRGKKTYKDIVCGAMDVGPEFIEHISQKWTVDSRSVVIPATRGRVMRHRPRLNTWQLDFELTSRDEQLAPEVLKQILEYCGNYVGIGDYRPRFGRFKVTKFEAD